MWALVLISELHGLLHRTPPWKRNSQNTNYLHEHPRKWLHPRQDVVLPLLLEMVCFLSHYKYFSKYFSKYNTSYFCWVSPARMRILWTSMLALSESPDHQEETIFNMLDADQPFVSSQLNFNISRSPISFSVTSRNEWVLFVAIFSFLPHKNVEKC